LAEYRVNLDIFSGPMDLLLYLVRKEELDIYDIPIARITDQYVHYIDILRSLDIDVAGDFLVMASALMEIKSAMLLPTAQPEEMDADFSVDPRAELVRQLLEYKKFKDAANLLNAAADRQSERFPRPDAVTERLKPRAEPEVDLEQVSVWDLLEAFGSIMAATNPAGAISHIKDDTPIDLYQIEILNRLQSEGPMTFERLFSSLRNRAVMIGLFLALLELIRDCLVWAEQAGSSASIYLRPLTDEPAEQAVQKAILAASADSEDQQGGRAERAEKAPIQITELPPDAKPAASVEEYDRISTAEDHASRDTPNSQV